MQSDKDLLQSISAIYKYAFANQPVHRNTMRNKLLQMGKVKSQAKFSEALNYLLSAGKLTMEREQVSINSKLPEIGVFQSKGNEFYVVTPKSNKHYKVHKSVASGYRSGDLLEIIIEKVNDEAGLIILGKSKRKIDNVKVENREQTVVSEDNEEKGILGRAIKLSHDNLVFIPNNKSIPARRIPILNENQGNFQDKLCIMVLEDPTDPYQGGYITKIKGDAGNPIHEYDAIAETYGAIMSWGGVELEREIAQIPDTVNVDGLTLISEQQARYMQRGNTVDLRHIPFTTVDPATCKDMDDAIYSTINENGDIVCYTAVANVTKYVDLNSEIGKKYVEGGFTIYAPNKAYNILPPKLSTGVCSLNPNEDRLALVIKTVIDKKTGYAKESKIYDAIIRSQCKYSYEQAQEIVDSLEAEGYTKGFLKELIDAGEQLSLEEQVLLNYYAGQTIKKGFEDRQMIRFAANKEKEVIFDQDLADVVDIAPVEHLYYHEVIEAFMITANEATAKFANDRNLNNIYRIHNKPNTKKVDRANEFFYLLGIDFDGDLSADKTRDLIELIRGTSNEEIINKFLIKMQSRAVYSQNLNRDQQDNLLTDYEQDRISHYALQSPHYSHTTSPIRRTPDYVTHYNILAELHGTRPISVNTVMKVTDKANERQLEVDQAERDFEDINGVMYCEKHIGEKMFGRVTKFRTIENEDGRGTSILVIVRNEEKGINVEIPLSQIIGRSARGCELSDQRCAVYDQRGDIVLTICKPIDFYIQRADRKEMKVVGKTNKDLVREAEMREKGGRRFYKTNNSNNNGKNKNANKKGKRSPTFVYDDEPDL